VRAAPAVELDIRRGGAWLWIAALLSGVCAAALAAWVTQRVELPAAPITASAAFIAGSLLGWRFTPIDTGVLGWDGRQWRFAGQAGDLRVMFDVGPWLLLRFDASDTRRRAWLATSERTAGNAWTALRTAVYSRRSNRDDSDNTSATRM
jgi:hypothetical protein